MKKNQQKSAKKTSFYMNTHLTAAACFLSSILIICLSLAFLASA
ncbi:MAG: hypothetical protein Q9M28_11160 [Mariprofundaceae bacterium]|nr:hypothetical protein [Mariprofundaceae bacterium]